jgi:UDP-N-acetylglucosamine 4,6-dehydratase
MQDKSIAITGGTGTLGQALVAEILPQLPRRLAIISRGEARQAEMKQQWPEDGPLRYFIGDVRDYDRMLYALEGCDIIIHAAALKRIEVCEREPEEAYLTNVVGTRNVARAARELGAKRFILISSDKACAAVTTYGATKYLAERLTIGANNYNGPRTTRYSAVRYGNVLGSTGSVLQIIQSADGFVPITHPDMTRFWWTPQQAAQFVLSCLEGMRGGEVIIPKLPSMGMIDMAQAIMPDAKIKIIGLRGAEKIHEQLVSLDEGIWTTEFQDRYVIAPHLTFWDTVPQDGRAVLPGWGYDSGSNPNKLTAEQLREMLE